MTDTTPISSPILTTKAPPASSSSSDPISPISRSKIFPNKTAAVVMGQTRLIDTNTRAINDTPVELDGGAISPEDSRRRGTGGSVGVGGSVMRSPADEEDIDAEFLGGEENLGREARAKRAEMLATRSKDPSVIVDVPQDPTAEEVEAARSADGMVTPGLSATGGLPRAFGGR
ncbi:hypothetical protein EJ02DRAFT_458214 [Clathrospora elynae]|uniref:Uncharacterized protein n=1 Tax=Clathrospora elynae TaxID=706981 RepID=A0A6A5SKZ4_9PLEO|nr:hypothetical protein EJ02DRAFT_458214 [Clathrospora elynae]